MTVLLSEGHEHETPLALDVAELRQISAQPADAQPPSSPALAATPTNNYYL